MKKRLKKKMTTHYYCFRKNVNGKLTPHRYRRKKRYHCPRYAQWTYKHMYNPPRFEKHKIRELLADFELHEERGRYVFSRLNGAHLTLADDHLFNKIGLLSFPYIDFELGVILICLGILSEGEPWYDYYDDGSDNDVWTTRKKISIVVDGIKLPATRERVTGAPFFVVIVKNLFRKIYIILMEK